MSDKGKKGSVFAGRTEPGRGEGPRPSRGPGRGAQTKPVRPLKEYRERLAREAQRAKAEKVPLKRRVAAAFPLFGFIGVPEIGLFIAVTSAITLIWVWPHLKHWGFLLVGLGFAVMRYGKEWLEKE
ncbi:MAG: hypothetical protein K6U08_01140 [Firmicutes bacterium]|nr:hypothetical protein [Bacillota bacterium]